MAVQDWGNPSFRAGSQQIVSAPSTTVLVTLASSVVQGAGNRDIPFRVTWIVGCGDGEPSTVAGVWWLDHAKSTDQSTASTSLIDRTVVLTAAGQSAQFVTGPHIVDCRSTAAEFFRVVMETTVANAAAKIVAEPLT